MMDIDSIEKKHKKTYRNYIDVTFFESSGFTQLVNVQPIVQLDTFTFRFAGKRNHDFTIALARYPKLPFT